MKPLPAEGRPTRQPAGNPIRPLADGPRSGSNRKSRSPVERLYPWLLVTSTAMAGFFCYLYLTKPVLPGAIVPPVGARVMPGQEQVPAVVQIPVESTASVLDGPSGSHLPGDAPATTSKPGPARSGAGSPFEETNYRVQHVVTAKAPNGVTKRLDFKVPVLYRSRNLLWTRQDLAKARDLLQRLSVYQEKSRALRAEAAALETSWNALLERSTPSAGLQADSPTLIGNQELPGVPVVPTSPDAQESIHIQPARK